MAGDDKKIEFKVAVDDVSMARAKTSIDQLLASTKALSEAFRGVGGSGFGTVSSTSSSLPGVVSVTGTAGAGAGGALTATITKEADTLKKLAESSKDAMRQMTDSVKQATTQQNQALLQLQQTANATSAALRGAGAGAVPGAWSGTGAGVYAGAGVPPGGGLPPPPPPGGPPPPPPGGPPRWWQYGGTGLAPGATIFGRQGFGLSSFMNIGARLAGPLALRQIAKMGVESYVQGGSGIFDESGSGYGHAGVGVGTAVIAAEARRGQFAQSISNRLLRGDASDLLAQAMMDPSQQAAYERAGGGWARAGKWAFMDTGRAWRLLTQGPGVVGSEIDTELAQDRDQVLKNIKASSQMYGSTIAHDFFNDRYRRMANFERVTGGASIARDRSNFGDLEKWAAANNVSAEQAISKYASLRGLIGGSAGMGMAKWSTLAQAQGFNIDPLIASTTRAQAQSGAAGPGVGNFLGGGIATQAGLELGQLILGTGFNPMGQTGGAGVLAAFQAGFHVTGKAKDFNTVQRFGLGMGALNSITTGTNSPYQRATNTLIAAKVAGAAGPRAIDLLASMPANQLLDVARNPSKITPYMRDNGITPGMVKQYLSQSVTAGFQNQFIGAGNTNAVRAGKAFIASGSTDVFAYSKTLKSTADREAFGAALGGALNLNQEQALGLEGILYGAGRGQALSSGGVGGGIRSAPVAAALGRDAEMLGKQYEQLIPKQETLTDLFKVMGKTFDITKTQAENFTLSVLAVGDAMKEAADKVMGRDPGKTGEGRAADATDPLVRRLNELQERSRQRAAQLRGENR